MLFDLKPIFFLGLAATAYASPLSVVDDQDLSLESRSIEARAAAKEVDCNGKKFTAQDITSAISAARGAQRSYDGGDHSIQYPKPNSNGEGLFASKANINLYEFPLFSGKVYSGKGFADKYRVITNQNYVYMGSIYHVGGNSFKKCIDVEEKERQQKQKEEEQKKKSEQQSKESKDGKDGKDGKEGHHGGGKKHGGHGGH